MTCLPRFQPSPHHCVAPLLLALLLSQPALAAEPLSPPAITTVDLSREPLPPLDPSIPEQSLRIGNASFKGRFITDAKSGVITGQVTISWDNGDRFSGRMISGKRQGPGKFEWANGQSYEGDWRDDMPDGRGSQIFASGDRYEGDMKAGVPEGFGSYSDKAGNRYEGNWQAGLKHGKGKYQWANGQSYNGDWVQDHPSGQGELIFANGDKYTGAVKAGLPEGKGSKIFASSGDRYEGEFKAGEAHGSGNYLWKSGDLYQGAWASGRKTGAGRYTWVNGDYWEGNFSDDRQLDGRLYFTPNIIVDQAAIEKLVQQTRAAYDSGGTRSVSDKPLDVARLSAIPMVALELKVCERPEAALDCRQRVLREVETGSLFKHNWQTMFSDNAAGKAPTSYEVDKSSVSELGRVFSWFRFLNSANGDSRNTGIKYDCRSEALEIQLLYNCTGGAQTATCTLDRNFDKYVGKAIPAATIKGWFKSACERGG
ncbi:hypothetical protein GCM10027046_20230 [Uliginosibacterium flavum]|uniref:MORN repeat-containing protein n=1 Tax=Uliginosibacterium flavum TaxID=1396831 RepID=A0ABV2TFZ0_9RHOO